LQYIHAQVMLLNIIYDEEKQDDKYKSIFKAIAESSTLNI
jgi:hypothetical protein